MKIDILDFQHGNVKNFGIWEDKKREFKLSIRWNESKKVYECFKLYFDTNEEIIIFTSKELVDIIIKTCYLANRYAKEL